MSINSYRISSLYLKSKCQKKKNATRSVGNAVFLCMIVFACINKATFIFLQAMGNAVASTMLSMVREIVFGVGFALLLPIFFGLNGVLYSMPLSDILTSVISAIITKTYKQLSIQKILIKASKSK